MSRFYFYNVLQELDAEGEYFVVRTRIFTFTLTFRCLASIFRCRCVHFNTTTAGILAVQCNHLLLRFEACLKTI